MSNRSSAAKRSEPQAGKPASRPVAVPSSSGMSGHLGFDRLIYERVRLGIMSALATNDHLTFNELKSLFNASDGNLGAHARKLEEAGYVACTKSFEARRPKTIYRITALGRKALLRYLEHIEAVIKATRRD
ncbi:MAG TPA: transcriptional regulator [Steroidobacteraceae bacterium]|nr:transcriptional regulator [Steroidobacteraceae bacterium]